MKKKQFIDEPFLIKSILVLFSIVMILSLNLSIAFAHPGGTDAQGGHIDHSTGEYHYHHGYPAHQHPNGVCPYENEEGEYLEEDIYDDEIDEYEEDNGYNGSYETRYTPTIVRESLFYCMTHTEDMEAFYSAWIIVLAAAWILYKIVKFIKNFF